MSLHPQIIGKDGRKEFVVLPYEEFLLMQAEIEDYEDLRTLREERPAAMQNPPGFLKSCRGKSKTEFVRG